MTEKTKELVTKYTDQAYHEAVRLTAMAVHIGDNDGAKMFSECARELMVAGYHKYPKRDIATASSKP